MLTHFCFNCHQHYICLLSSLSLPTVLSATPTPSSSSSSYLGERRRSSRSNSLRHSLLWLEPVKTYHHHRRIFEDHHHHHLDGAYHVEDFSVYHHHDNLIHNLYGVDVDIDNICRKFLLHRLCPSSSSSKTSSSSLSSKTSSSSPHPQS